jgi:hypothetical protein
MRCFRPGSALPVTRLRRIRQKRLLPSELPAKTGITGQSVWGKLQFAKRTDFEFSIPAEKLQLHLNRSSDQLSPRTPPAIVHPE